MARFPYLLGVVLAAGLPGLAQADSGRSPFMPPNSAPSGPNPTDPNAIELRGIMATDQGMKYNIYYPSKSKSVWVGVNESGYDFTIKSADPTHDSVTVASGGQQVTLALKASKTQAGGGVGGGGLAPGGIVLRPTTADEAVRLQAVADEVRRRRLLREQAAAQQSGQQPGTIPPALQTGPGAVQQQGGAYSRRNRPQQ